MKRILTFFLAGAAIAALGGAFTACNDPVHWEYDSEEGTMISSQMTGTVIGRYSNGFGSTLVQVDKKYSIGKTIEYSDGTHPCLSLPKPGTFNNVIQVQVDLPVHNGERILFSVRKFAGEQDNPLFIIGDGLGNALCGPPDVPRYVVTDFEIENN